MASFRIIEPVTDSPRNRRNRSNRRRSQPSRRPARLEERSPDTPQREAPKAPKAPEAEDVLESEHTDLSVPEPVGMVPLRESLATDPNLATVSPGRRESMLHALMAYAALRRPLRRALKIGQA
jgi:hypothetical protein